MATYIGNPDPPNVRLTRPAGSPTVIGTGSVDDAVGAGSFVLTGATGSVTSAQGTITLGNNVNVSGAGSFTQTGTHGETVVDGYTTELITISTTTTVTTSTTNLLPAKAVINAVLVNPVVAIATATSFKVGDPTSDARFVSFTTSIGANQASLGLNQWNPALATTLALSAAQAAATTVKITTAGSLPTAGQVRVTVYSAVYGGPTS